MRKWEQEKRYLREEESVASTTVFLEGSFTTLVINTYVGIEVATFDITGGYLNLDMPKDNFL